MTIGSVSSASGRGRNMACMSHMDFTYGNTRLSWATKQIATSANRLHVQRTAVIPMVVIPSLLSAIDALLCRSSREQSFSNRFMDLCRCSFSAALLKKRHMRFAAWVASEMPTSYGDGASQTEPTHDATFRRLPRMYAQSRSGRSCSQVIWPLVAFSIEMQYSAGTRLRAFQLATAPWTTPHSAARAV